MIREVVTMLVKFWALMASLFLMGMAAVIISDKLYARDVEAYRAVVREYMRPPGKARK